MPMIDVYAENGLIPADLVRTLGTDLTLAVLRAEGVTQPGPFHLSNTASFIHLMGPGTALTAAGGGKSVRVQIITPPNSLSRSGQIQLVKEITDLIVKHTGDPTQAERTWVLLSEAAEGGWGIAGTAYGREEFVALGAKARAASQAT